MSGILSAFVGGTYSSAPVNSVAPVVSGTATFGQTLSCTTGTWTGVPTPTYTYQWQRVTTNISGATSSTYVLVQADVGSTIRCVVTATNSVGSASANSNSTATVAATVPGAPTIGTATATGSSTATVAYTAPASNGGATITSYTATSSPGGITGTLSTAGSGTITVTGLSESTSYTFTVTATNSVGQSAASAASNSITTSASYWVTYMGQRNITWNPYSSVSGGSQVYGWDVSSSGYTMHNALASPNRAGYFGVLSPSGTRYGGYNQTSGTLADFPYSVLNAQTNKSNYVVVSNSNYNFALWDPAAGTKVGNYPGWGIGFSDSFGNISIDSSNTIWNGLMYYDPKAGQSYLIWYGIVLNGNVFNRTFTASNYFGDTYSHIKTTVRSDGSLFFNIDSFGFVFNSNASSLTAQRSATAAGFNLGSGNPSVVLCDASNNLYVMGDTAGGTGNRVVKTNSAITSGTRYNYSGQVAGGGAAIYGNYLYTMYSSNADYVFLTAIDITTMAVAWSKKFLFTISGNTVSNVVSGANGTGVRANANGVFMYVVVPNQDSGARFLYSFKVPLTGSLTNTSYSIGGGTSMTISNTGVILETTSSVAYNTLSLTFSYGSSTEGSATSYTYASNGSVMPTASKTTLT